MPLDPQIAPIVEASNAAAAELPSVWEQTVEDRRQGYLARPVVRRGQDRGHQVAEAAKSALA